MTDPHTHITNHLLTAKSLPVSSSWLSQVLSSQRVTTTPLSALTQTALFRILASDFTTSLSRQPDYLLPVDISDPSVQERRIPGPLPLQLLDIEDIGTSSWSQVEAIESIERGEEMRGREIIRTVTRDESGDSTQTGSTAPDSTSGNNNNPSSRNGMSSTSSGPHRLVLQDARGTKAIAIDLKPVEGVATGKTAIGTKIVLNNATVARGMVLLEPASTVVLGGKIEQLDKEWRAGRKDRLVAKIEQQRADSETSR
ncbi:hypothetical protein AJ80_02073 [Polytolypa hystricis UAMH7299]|uniref:RecQ-mediated genome instability protein 1 n=1 Tax=Polytolypa hystricis (strain UAMH7299) TaxID=1447883 RepID=A0A2B7YR88_POLH7|nr:hypothetical protein AJ80_02073 [Polytolypa hystricis UAMH7299]